MEEEDDFSNIDETEDDPAKAGFKGRWAGVANATPEKIIVETHIESAVPEETRGFKNCYFLSFTICEF